MTKKLLVIDISLLMLLYNFSHFFLHLRQGSSASAKSKGFKWKKRSSKESSTFANGSAGGNNGALGMPVEDVAATQIQTAFRAYKVHFVTSYSH